MQDGRDFEISGPQGTDFGVVFSIEDDGQGASTERVLSTTQLRGPFMEIGHLDDLVIKNKRSVTESLTLDRRAGLRLRFRGRSAEAKVGQVAGHRGIINRDRRSTHPKQRLSTPRRMTGNHGLRDVF